MCLSTVNDRGEAGSGCEPSDPDIYGHGATKSGQGEARPCQSSQGYRIGPRGVRSDLDATDLAGLATHRRARVRAGDPKAASWSRLIVAVDHRPNSQHAFRCEFGQEGARSGHPSTCPSSSGRPPSGILLVADHEPNNQHDFRCRIKPRGGPDPASTLHIRTRGRILA